MAPQIKPLLSCGDRCSIAWIYPAVGSGEFLRCVCVGWGGGGGAVKVYAQHREKHIYIYNTFKFQRHDYNCWLFPRQQT